MSQEHINILGTNTPVMDARSKVTGTLTYVDDMKLHGMLYAKVLFSPLPHARIKKIDIEEAKALPGVRAVITHHDSPNVRYNGNGEDSDILPSELVFDEIVRYVGDKVAAVAAESPAIAEEAIKRIHVEYEELPFYLDPEESAEPGAYQIHEGGNIMEEVNLATGDLKEGFAASDKIANDCYQFSAIHHAAMEPHGSIAVYDAEGKLTIYTPSQDVFGKRKNLAKIFDMPMSRIRVISPAMGGGFGGKIDLTTEPVTAMLAMKTRRPVKLVYQRIEDIPSTTTRHAEKVYVRTGISQDGIMKACDYKVFLSAGAQSGATMSVAWAAGDKFFKLFQTANMRYHAIPAYTNRSIAGAMRGFGSPQLFFVLNSQLNKLAREAEIDMCDLLAKNFHLPNTKDQRGVELGNLRMLECLNEGKALFGWEEALQKQTASKNNGADTRIGVGVAAAPHGSSLYGVMPDTCGVMIKMNEDGTLTMFTGVSDMGNGSNTIQKMLISEELQIPMEYIACVKTDTETTLFDVGAYASRGTYVGGNAALKAAKKVKEKIQREAAEILQCEEAEICLGDNCAFNCNSSEHKVSMREIAIHAHEKERDIAVTATYGTSALPISGGVHFVMLKVHLLTGEVELLDYTAVHDVGCVLNPLNVEGQLHGGIHMGIGYALSEGLELLENGELKGKRLKDCGLVRADKMPPIRIKFLESFEESGPYGGKSIGECATVPAAAAVINALNNALDTTFYSLPVKKQDILNRIK
ncbi:MAG: xanthine dehydrogenase family protein molybdopterin-binding subunit [Lachnospiraceae bacterium]